MIPLDGNIIENRNTPKVNSYITWKKNNTPIDVIFVGRTPKVNECELVSHSDQQFYEIQNTPAIRSTLNVLSHTEDIPNTC